MKKLWPAVAGVLLGLLVIFCLAQCAAAAEPAKSDPTPMTEVEAAVIGLAAAYYEHPHYYEYGGVIVKQPDGRFNVSSPLTNGNASSVEIDEDNEGYNHQYPIVADYHTHPCLDGYVPGVFSPADLHSMREAGHGGYILDECTGDIHYWKPGDPYDKMDDADRLIQSMSGKSQQTATGKIVGHIAVDGKPIKL